MARKKCESAQERPRSAAGSPSGAGTRRLSRPAAGPWPSGGRPPNSLLLPSCRSQVRGSLSLRILAASSQTPAGELQQTGGPSAAEHSHPRVSRALPGGPTRSGLLPIRGCPVPGMPGRSPAARGPAGAQGSPCSGRSFRTSESVDAEPPQSQLQLRSQRSCKQQPGGSELFLVSSRRVTVPN